MKVLRENLKLATSKADYDDDNSKEMKRNAGRFANIFNSNFNDSVQKSNFPSSMQISEITTVFKIV